MIPVKNQLTYIIHQHAILHCQTDKTLQYKKTFFKRKYLNLSKKKTKLVQLYWFKNMHILLNLSILKNSEVHTLLCIQIFVPYTEKDQQYCQIFITVTSRELFFNVVSCKILIGMTSIFPHYCIALSLNLSLLCKLNASTLIR